MEQSKPLTLQEQRMTNREYAVSLLLQSIGEDTSREGLQDTPKRVAKMYEELFSGYEQDPAAILSTVFNDEQHEELVLVRDIEFYSHCEHHMVPFHGVCHIAYIPNKSVVGISKLARLVECFAKRLQIQERMTKQIADAIMEHVGAKGVAVVIKASHLCMEMRGVKKPGTKTVTSAMRGVFMDKPEARAEVLELMKG